MNIIKYNKIFILKKLEYNIIFILNIKNIGYIIL